jgi:hypothetical protein
MEQARIDGVVPLGNVAVRQMTAPSPKVAFRSDSERANSNAIIGA